jgi:hypothetical protein
MKINCNYCSAAATGTRDILMDSGWARVVIFAPVRRTITACPLHHEELKVNMVEVLGPKWKDDPEIIKI